jgi:hypothetical protein
MIIDERYRIMPLINCTKAVLDYFKLGDVTLLGISMAVGFV